MGSAPNGYNTLKTNWQAADVVLPTDMNRIEGNTQAIEEGSRTIDPAQAPASNVGTLRQLLDWFANRIKAITGGTNWYDAPVATLANLLSLVNGHIGRTDNPHSVTAAQAGAAAAVHTHDDRYYTESESDGRYALKSNPVITGAISINDANTKLLEGSSNAARVQTNNGYVDIGPQNTSYAHIYTDRAQFYMNKDILVNGYKVWHSGNDGAGSGLDADTVDGKHATDFMNGTKVYGNVTYTDSIAASSTLTKTIALGGTYKHGLAVVGGKGYASFGTNSTKSKGFMVRGSSSYCYLRAFSRDIDTVVLDGGDYAVQAPTGNINIYVQDIYISGTDLVIIFKNNSAGAQSLDCKVAWEVW